jgi:tetratricopeptide (TPR) repeat protein
MANLYEKFGRVVEAEQTYIRVAEQNPSDAKACGALAAFYNKPLWDEAGAVFVENESKGARKAKFESAIQTLERCASLDPSDPSGYYKLAMFYWDKAYRDPLVGDKEKDAFADRGIASVDKSLEMKPDYWEAIIAKGLLYRVKAQVATNPKQRKEFLDTAVLLQKQAMELRKETQAAASGSTDVPAVPPEAAAAPGDTPK